MLPSDRALRGLEGIKFCITEVMGGGGFISNSLFIIKFALTPGLIILAMIKAIEIAIKVVNKYKKIDFPPILPKEAVSSRFVTPVTIEKNTTGTINILSAVMNIDPNIFIGFNIYSIKFGTEKLIKLPKIIPINNAINILLVRLIKIL
jgi:hypothetical protein